MPRRVLATLSFDEAGNKWVLAHFIEDAGLTLKLLVASGEDEVAPYEYEIWQGDTRILAGEDDEWYQRMRAEFPYCIRVFDGMLDEWLSQKAFMQSTLKGSLI